MSLGPSPSPNGGNATNIGPLARLHEDSPARWAWMRVAWLPKARFRAAHKAPRIGGLVTDRTAHRATAVPGDSGTASRRRAPIRLGPPPRSRRRLGHSWDTGHQATARLRPQSPRKSAFTLDFDSGRGRYRTADRWCV